MRIVHRHVEVIMIRVLFLFQDVLGPVVGSISIRMFLPHVQRIQQVGQVSSNCNFRGDFDTNLAGPFPGRNYMSTNKG